MADRTLHIGIDGRELVGRPHGVGRFLHEILRRWLDDPKQSHRFTVFLPSAAPPTLARHTGPVTWRVLPTGSPGTWWEQTTLFRAAADAAPDVFFAPAYTSPIRLACPVVLTIHDLSYFAHPEWFAWREGVRRRWVTRRSAQRAAAIVAVSEFSAREIVTRLGIPRDKVHVVRHGGPVVAAPALRSAAESMILYVGSMFNRRRIPDLVEAFARVARTVPASRLELVGDNQLRPPFDPAARAAALGLADRIAWRPWVSDEELDQLYARAGAFAFLSEYEGFALTPLEAIAHGVPPVLLDTPVAREIYGDAAIFVQPGVDAVASALTALLTDSARRAALVDRGRALLASYSWDRAAAEVLHLIQEAARR